MKTKKLLATVTLGLAILAGMYMYFSATFLPIYVGGEYILGNRLLRYLLYAILAIVAIVDVSYLLSAPTKKRRKKNKGVR